ncbi:MAG TPA: Na+/H+ antiporter NhaC family protein [Candidatus Babeliales bacterium]|nr:Na+/H+ antiporter NhaC family protein [Candidatus Babeliales bacterium]
MINSWPVVLPPIVVLVIAFVTKNILLSLGLGVLSASVIATNGNILQALSLVLTHLKNLLLDPDNLYGYGFVLIVGIVVVLLNQTGGTVALARLMTNRLKTAKSAKYAAVLLSCCFFIDDYLSCLTVGHIMRPITDRLKIPKVKLAFILASIPAPLAIIAPISSWVGVIVSQFDQAGINLHTGAGQLIVADPYNIFLQVIPFVFYSFIMLAAIWFIIYQEISFGLMHKHETIAAKTGNLFGGQEPIIAAGDQELNSANSSLTDFLFPILSLITLIFLGILYQGNYWLFGGSQTSIIAIFQQKYSLFPILFWAVLSSLIFSILLALWRNKLNLNQLPKIFTDGINLMVMAILILIIAALFGAILRDNLQTGFYLASLLLSHIDLIFLPAMIFVVAFLVAAATGSAWGTMAVVTPLTVPMIVALLQLQIPVSGAAIAILLPSLGAILAGAAAGDHFSPVSGVTVMSASSSGSYLIDHIKTQMFYATPAIIGTLVAYIVSGALFKFSLLTNVLCSFAAGTAVCFAILLVLSRIYRGKF